MKIIDELLAAVRTYYMEVDTDAFLNNFVTLKKVIILYLRKMQELGAGEEIEFVYCNARYMK